MRSCPGRVGGCCSALRRAGAGGDRAGRFGLLDQRADGEQAGMLPAGLPVPPAARSGCRMTAPGRFDCGGVRSGLTSRTSRPRQPGGPDCRRCASDRRIRGRRCLRLDLDAAKWPAATMAGDADHRAGSADRYLLRVGGVARRRRLGCACARRGRACLAATPPRCWWSSRRQAVRDRMSGRRPARRCACSWMTRVGMTGVGMTRAGCRCTAHRYRDDGQRQWGGVADIQPFRSRTGTQEAVSQDPQANRQAAQSPPPPAARRAAAARFSRWLWPARCRECPHVAGNPHGLSPSIAPHHPRSM